MASVNKVILVGNLGKDPELRYTQSGVAFCSFSLATTDNWTDQSGQRQEKTEWHRITVWKKQAENCAKYLRKGSSAYVEGRLQTRSWDDQQSGQKRYSTEIVADNVKFLGSAGSGASRGDSSYDSPSSGFNPPPVEPPSDSVFGSHNSSSLDDIPF
jgi:single-strand DNA-binding protein